SWRRSRRLPTASWAADMDDPFKEMVRQYDAAVVTKGGRSIFDLRPSVRIAVFPAKDSIPGRKSKWTGERLANLRAAYASDEKLDVICRLWSINRGTIMSLAVKHNWPRRRPIQYRRESARYAPPAP